MIKGKRLLLGSIPIAAVLILWELLHLFRVIPEWILKSPYHVFATLWTALIDGTLARIVATSMINAAVGFSAALIMALVLGLCIGLKENAQMMFQPLLSVLYPIPSIAWLPLIIIFLGFSRRTVWAVIFLSAFFKIIYNVIGGVRSVDRTLIWSAVNLGMNRWRLIREVILPGAFPQILTGIRLGFGSAWRSLVGAEMLTVGVGGLGSYIWTAQWFFRFDKVLAGIIVIGCIGFAIEHLLFGRIEKRTIVRWGMIREGN
ncbi:MAG TPA: ABC transporter permease [Patescibacteria group bacterium]|nr:ABC transporter permease [Patescibacteria group bacterium]